MKAGEIRVGPSRRGFLELSGAGLFVFFSAGPSPAFQQAATPAYPSDWNAYLRIGADGRVTCFTGKVELGQGTTTSLAQLVAEELDVDFDSVDMIMADTDLFPWDRGTVGSLGISQFGPHLRAAGAEARAVLLRMASERLGVPVERLQVKAGLVSDSTAPAKHVTYAEIAGGQRIERHLEGVPLKPASAYHIAGQSLRRKDAWAKITGRAKYAADVILPNMLYARLVRPPALGARLKNADTSEAAKLPGVRVIRDGALIAVLHEKADMAAEALTRVKAEFDLPAPGPDDTTIFDHLVKNAPPWQVVAEKGSVAEGEKVATAVVAHRYLNSYVSHAVIEPHAAMVNIEGSQVTVWASAQVPYRVKQEVAQALEVPPQNVRVKSLFVGGGFGGKCSGTPPVKAARLAKICGRPVQVAFDRAEEFLFTIMRPAAVVDVRSGLTGDGKLAFWEFEAYGGGPQESRCSTTRRTSGRCQPAVGRRPSIQPAYIRSTWVFGVHPRALPTRSHANPIWTLWRPRRVRTRWNSASTTFPTGACGARWRRPRRGLRGSRRKRRAGAAWVSRAASTRGRTWSPWRRSAWTGRPARSRRSASSSSTTRDRRRALMVRASR